jgi:hypothetical protein
MFSNAVGQGLTVCTDFSADIGDGCPIQHEVDGSNFASFRFGEVSECIEMSFTAEALRAFLKLGNEALSELDAQFAKEEAKRAQRQQAAEARALISAGERSA